MGSPILPVETLFRSAFRFGKQHLPTILTGVGIGCMIGGTVMAVRATPKALDKINKYKEENDLSKNPGKIDAVKITVKDYLPAIGLSVLGAACIIGADRKHLQKQAAMAAAYAILKDDFSNYRDGALKVLGKRNEEKLRTKIAEDQLKNDPINAHRQNNTIVNTGHGTTLFYDSLSGRYFYHDLQKFKAAVNEANRDLNNGLTMSLNEFYGYVDLPDIELGRLVGWNINEGLIEPQYSYPPNDDGPCIVVTFATRPSYEYCYS